MSMSIVALSAEKIIAISFDGRRVIELDPKVGRVSESSALPPPGDTSYMGGR